MENTFLPKDYIAPSSNGNYMKFQNGDNRFRVLSSAIVGYEYWTTENKPVRSKTPFAETPNAKLNQQGRVQIKHFWAFIVWDLSSKKITLLEVTQAGIQQAISTFVNNNDWGVPQNYDIIVNKAGEGLETKYTVTPCPHSPTTPEVKKEYEDMNINLDALFTGDDPFSAQPKIATEQEEIIINNVGRTEPEELEEVGAKNNRMTNEK